MNTTTQTPASNDLRHKIITNDVDGNTMHINIRLNDECKNGHQDFAITADIYQRGKPKTDKYCIMGGCCHEEILKVRPDLKIFVDLHLCDYTGTPMHAIENGFYFLREGFNEVKPGSIEFKQKFCEYYRVSPEQFDVLNTSEDKIQYATKIISLGILEQWADLANTAIRWLEKETGKQFIVDSRKTQFNAPTPDQIADEKQKQASGYYTTEAKEQRKQDAINKERAKMEDDFKKEIDKIKLEHNIKMQLFDIAGKIAVSNTIFYSHTKQIVFNWQSKYDGGKPLSEEIINKIKTNMALPEGVTFGN